MRVQIYQINHERDSKRDKFMSLKDGQTPDSSIYDEVFDAEIEENDLEDIYRRFNTEGHPLYRGHSLSVSDIVVIETEPKPLVGKIRFYNSSKAYEECSYTDLEQFRKAIREAHDVGRTIEIENLQGKNIPSLEIGAYFCDSFGFRKVDFDKSQTQKPDNLMRVVYVEPNKPPYIAEVEHTLEGEQKAVKGLIEAVYFEDSEACIICNEEAKLIGMEGNRRVGDNFTIIAGPFFVCGTTEDDFRGLTDEEVTIYMDLFKEPDQISQEEVEADTGFAIIYGI